MCYVIMTVKEFNKFRIDLLEWWKENKREFLWRKVKDPYKILCAEIMLQQTRAENVEDIYIKFVQKYPSIYSLNNADPENIKNLIKPLGLVYRYKVLKDNAKIIVEEFEGQIPNTQEKLLDLPGVGQYISNAVLCFAFEENVGVVDTNTIRILKRVFDIHSEKSSARLDDKIQCKINELVGKEDCRKINYALLDFGAKICKKASPNCEECFAKSYCCYVCDLNEEE